MLKQKKPIIEYILFGVIVLGLIASLIDLIHNRSLWLDEAMLSLNIVNKTYTELLKPLDMNQVAPIGFLMLEKFLSGLFGNHDWSLKIFPFLSFILSVPLLYRITMRMFHSKKIGLLTCSLFATNIFIIRYASEVKQYSTDILIMLLILNLAFEYNIQNRKKHVLTSAVIGSLSIWFSNIAIIGLFVIGIFYLYKRKSDNHHYRNLIIIPIVFWLLIFVVYYSFFIYGHPTRSFMVEYWTLRNAFMPHNMISKEFYLFLFNKMKMLFPFLLGFKYNWIFSLSLCIIGIFHVAGQKKILFLLLTPILVHLILSSFQLYPFDKRTVLYVMPALMIFIATGLLVCYNMVIKFGIPIPSFFLSFLLTLNMIHLYKKIPTENEEIKHSLDYIHSNIKSGDQVYVYFVTEPAFLFYKEHYPVLKKCNYAILGNWKMKSWKDYENQIDSIKGKSWIVFTEVYDIGAINGEQFIIDRIQHNGCAVISKRKYIGSSCYEIYKR